MKNGKTASPGRIILLRLKAAAAAPKIKIKTLQQAAAAAAGKTLKKIPGEILVVLGGDQDIKRVKKIFWGRARLTDVVSFFYGRESSPQAEIVINVAQAKRQGRWGWEPEIIFLFIHGLLHMLGFNDNTPKKRKIMLALGKEILEEALQASGR